MTPPVENETPMEDIEEGEIADDVENSGEVVSVHDNLPISQTKAASLNDSAASRFRKDGGRREENPPSHPHTPRFVMEEGPPPGSNQWRGESLRYSNGNYSSNLYNLAWAKAVVQSKPTFSLETNNNDKGKGEILKNGGGGTGGLSRSRRDLGSEKSNDSRNGRNPKAKTDDYNEFVSASGSSSSEGNDRVVTSKKGIAENGQKKISDKVAVINISDDDDDADDDDNDEKIVNRTGDDDREEGELEEGEIDAGLASAVGSQASSSEERFENSGDFLHGGGRIDSSRALSDRHTRYRDKSPAKSSDRSWPKDLVRQSSYHQDDGKQRLKDQERERKLDVIAEMVKNVTVKDAQKSFVGVCHQLHKALECLNETNPQIPVNNVASLIKQIFAGIRAVYAVRNTWSGIQQNQDRSSAFPRLLQYVNREARNLFTSKQIKELEIMLLSVPTTVRISKADSAEEEKEERPLYAMHSSQENAIKPEGREITSLNIETTTENILTKSIVTLNNANEITRDSRTLKPNEYTAAPTSTETDSRSSSSNSLSACGPESSNNSCYKPLEGFEEPDDSNLPNHLYEGSVADLNRRDSKCNSLGVQPSPKLSDPLDRSIQDENAYWQSDTVNAFTYYQEKFGGGQLSNSTRLPSPTPSEDGEEGEASNQGVEVSMFSDDKEPQQSVEEREVRDMDISENVSVPSTYGSIPQLNSDMESQVVGPRIQTDFSEELEVPAFQSKDSKGAVETGKSINKMTGSSRKLQPKSRDPRRRVAESEFYTMDLNRRPCHPDSNVITREHVVGRFLDRKHKSDDDLPQDPHNSKRLRNHSDHHLFSSGFPVVTSGCGGWLEENTVIPASTDWDQTSEMEIDSTGALSRSSDLRSDSNSIFTTDTQNATIENRNKRQKTESFYQAGISMDPVSEANKIQPNSTDINLNPRMPSVGEEERGERKETEITEIGQQTNSSVALNSNIIPSVLKDIAVNPTMLMHLIKQEQQRLSAQAAQKPEQSQQTNPPSGPTIASVITSGKVIAADPSMLKDSNLQQKTAQQAPATATKPATQVTSTAGDPGKPRMKPRDPRRILHMNSGNDIVNLNGTDKQFAPVSKQIRMASGPATTESAPKLQQAPSLPNIEQNFKEKLARIAEMLKNSEMRTLRVISSQMSVGQSVRETDPIDLEQGSIESSKFLEVDIQQAIEVPKDSSMIIPPLQSLSNENTIITQNHLNPWGDVDHLLEGLSEEQRIAIQQERARRIGEQNKMFSAKKLCLVLDLDHTLLNSAKFTEIDPVHEEMLRKKEEQDREKPQRQLFRFPHMGMWTKLRPGIWNFLDRASKLYELHVYTMGNKVYATEMAKVLDPTGTLFAGRVISKGDEADLDGDDRLPKSKDLDGVLGMESAVVIIDDSARVWPHHRHNLIVVERYMYFPCSRRQFGLPGLSLLEADVDERPEDGTLASSLAVIEKIHYNFFSNKLLHEVDVREFLAAEQQKILKDCKVVFSRVFPVGEAQPHLHPLWQMAEQFGALCTTQIDDEVTHVVALAPGTDKVNWALATGRYVVHPGWLEASALLYRRANERDFSITMNHFPCPPH